jgi:DNA-binding XRE family transcriptional regulator
MPAHVPPTVTFDFTPLRRERIRRGISHEQLGQAAGMHWHTVYRIETNRTVPSLWRAVALARALGKPLQSLFEVTG